MTTLEVGPLDDDTTTAVRDLAHRAQRADGTAALSEQPLLDLTHDDPDLTHVVAIGPASRAGRPREDLVIGYAQVDRRGPVPSAEIVVHPEHRRHGVGSMLLRTARRDATLPSRSGAPVPHAPLHVWAHGFLPAAQEFARAHSLQVVRELRRLEVPLSATAHGSLADALTATGARVFRVGEDEDAWLTANTTIFADHPEQGRMNRRDLAARQEAGWFDPELFFVVPDAADVTAIAGYVWLKVEDPPRGEVYVLGVAPELRGRRLGERLTTLALAALQESGCTIAELWVDATNTAALRTYERAGFVLATRDVQLALPSPTDAPPQANIGS